MWMCGCSNVWSMKNINIWKLTLTCNPGPVAGLSTTARHAQCGRRASLVIQFTGPGCHCPTTSLQFVEAVTTNCDNFGRLSVLVGRHHKDDCTGLCYQLQHTVRWHHQWTDAMPEVSSERYHQTRDGHQARRCDHISPVLCQLHWHRVRQRVLFKIATLVHRFLTGNALSYLVYNCQLVADARVRQLHSADTRTLVSRIPGSFGDRTFATAGPEVWKSLPPNLRLCGVSYSKTFLYRQWGHGAVCTVLNCIK